MPTKGAVHSMTGYALVKKTVTHPKGVTLEVELKSVNQRFFEWQFKCPEPYRAHELSLRALAQSSIERGKCECRLTVTHTELSDNLTLNNALVTQLLGLNEQLCARGAAPITSAELMRWPGVLTQAESGAIDSETLQSVFIEALKEFQVTRQTEGARIHDFMQERLAQALAICETTEKLAHAEQAALPSRLQQKLHSLGAQLDPLRLETEIVMAVQKMDVSEELDRLNTHLLAFSQLLKEGGLLGKRLDFLCQELNREANTLGAKASDIGLTNHSVELKVIIEQLREQVQNVE